MIRRYLARRKMRWAVRYVQSHRRSIQPNTVAEWIVKQWGFSALLGWIRMSTLDDTYLLAGPMPDGAKFRRAMRELEERRIAQD